MKNLIFFLFLVVFCFSTEAQTEPSETSTYYFIRHAEKDKSNTANKDPKLIKKGKERAKRWASYFKDKKLDAVYSTNYKRTIETATPTAHHNNLKVILYHPKKVNYAEFHKNNLGKNVLVVGHSNTTPHFVNKIIGTHKYEEIDETVNYKLFKVTIKGRTITDEVIDVK